MSSERFRRCCHLHHPLRLLPAGATVAGRDSHPLWNGAFSRRTLKYNIRGGGDHHLGPQVLLAVELDALFDGDEADLAMDQRFHDLDHLPAVGGGFHGSVQ